jgi:transposase
MWSPCSKAPGEIDLGNTTVPGVKDCPIGGEKLPLVVISHGRGGSFIGHHDIAEMLADAGFVAGWDGDGLCLFAKRLERGRFVWPRAEEGMVVLSRAQLSMLLEGIDWRMPRRTWRPELAG